MKWLEKYSDFKVTESPYRLAFGFLLNITAYLSLILHFMQS
jgi:hypothetical protein